MGSCITRPIHLSRSSRLNGRCARFRLAIAPEVPLAPQGWASSRPSISAMSHTWARRHFTSSSLRVPEARPADTMIRERINRDTRDAGAADPRDGTSKRQQLEEACLDKGKHNVDVISVAGGTPITYCADCLLLLSRLASSRHHRARLERQRGPADSRCTTLHNQPNRSPRPSFNRPTPPPLSCW